CTVCHGGDPQSHDWQTAHTGLVKDPTWPSPEQACGECHAEIAATAVNGLHYTIAPLGRAVEERMGTAPLKVRSALEQACQKHCSQCHASCGQCHVSRPDYVGGGFLAQHRFQKTPPMDTTCASCHGGRVFGEFTGLNAKVPADTHFADAEMTCRDCHGADRMHAAAEGASSRFEAPARPRCENCHPADAPGAASQVHQTHRQKLACQVCHAGAVKHCFGCHVGTDGQGLAYYKCRQTVLDFKIGRNPAPSPERPFNFTVVRHVPVAPDTFAYYAPSALTRFDACPTWKPSAPHTIQRRTPQNRTCNSCHGNRRLFLAPADLAPGEGPANRGVYVSDENLPAAVAPPEDPPP
ncbi:MAG: hypothetical protein R3311_12280, partial [Oceanisphaera sp.]|nr:hypothetical protein [Oceanisphaera sp.]